MFLPTPCSSNMINKESSRAGFLFPPGHCIAMLFFSVARTHVLLLFSGIHPALHLALPLLCAAARLHGCSPVRDHAQTVGFTSYFLFLSFFLLFFFFFFFFFFSSVSSFFRPSRSRAELLSLNPPAGEPHASSHGRDLAVRIRRAQPNRRSLHLFPAVPVRPPSSTAGQSRGKIIDAGALVAKVAQSEWLAQLAVRADGRRCPGSAGCPTHSPSVTKCQLTGFSRRGAMSECDAGIRAIKTTLATSG